MSERFANTLTIAFLYLGGSASTGFDGDVYCTVILECTVEKMDTQAGMALALSQQGAN